MVGVDALASSGNKPSMSASVPLPTPPLSFELWFAGLLGASSGVDEALLYALRAECWGIGDSDNEPIVARSSSTLALIGAPLLSGLISMWILRSRSSSSESPSELE